VSPLPPWQEREDLPVEEPRPRRPVLRKVREAAQTLLLAGVVYLLVQFLVPPYAVDGASMAPNLSDGERLLVNRSVYAHFDANKIWNLLPGVDRAGEAIVYPFHAPERGEIVVFDPPTGGGEPYIKRVIGLPGDEIAFADGRVLVNGAPLPESYIDGAVTFCAAGPHCETTVPAGTVYVLGDNRRNSSDSRAFGPISADEVVGKAWISNWPPSDAGFIPEAEYE
jgi:signal peptidase I